MQAGPPFQKPVQNLATRRLKLRRHNLGEDLWFLKEPGHSLLKGKSKVCGSDSKKKDIT
jgi:hypothetical protein